MIKPFSLPGVKGFFDGNKTRNNNKQESYE